MRRTDKGEGPAAFSVQLSVDTATKLFELKAWLGAPTAAGALRVLVEQHHHAVITKAEERPLAQFGQGDFITRIKEEDV